MTTKPPPTPIEPSSESHAAHYITLARLCDIYDDMEKIRIGNENRIRTLVAMRIADGEEVEVLYQIVDALRKEQHKIELTIKHALRKHPLAPWLDSIIGIGERQGARLLGAMGDPYWNDRDDRPRRGPAELWAYCGLHTLLVDQNRPDTQKWGVGGDQLGSHIDHAEDDAQVALVNVAARKQHGQISNWNAEAKMRVYLIAESCMKQRTSIYRDVYDKRKENTVGRLHAALCYRCGPKGHPAKPGSPWSDAHRHADALRIVSKRILRDMWRESKRLHELLTDQGEIDTQAPCVDEHSLPADQSRNDTHDRPVGGSRTAHRPSDLRRPAESRR